ncbi:MAG: 50S ribosomal protein L13 [Candidatus Woesearchaeota archaeon]
MIIDAKDMIVGRLATHVAKQALLGETISIVNAEKAVITGKKDEILNKFKQRKERGAALVGPYYPRTPERLLKRMIRGMLPYKQPRGREAFERIKCYKGVPKQFEGKAVSLDQFNVNTTYANFITIEQISKKLGAKL